MKLLVTGGLGFIGSNFIHRYLIRHPNHHITNIDDELYGSNHLNLSGIEKLPNYAFVKGNITNKSLMEELIGESDAVVNFAAESFVDRSILNAESSLSSNVHGVFVILETVKKQRKKLIHVSTDEVFGSLQNGTANESSRFNPSSPYAATKAAAELLVNSYVETYDCDCVITRCTNNYGQRQFPEKLIPKVILLAHQNKKIPIYGTGENVRDWIYVDDHCDAIIDVLEKGKSGNSYNISANNEIDNITIVKKILSIMNKPANMIEFVDDRPGHDFRYSMNSSKIRKELGWKEKVNFESGLKQTIDWYLTNIDHWGDVSDKILNTAPWKN